jgi:hypothetical protein
MRSTSDITFLFEANWAVQASLVFLFFSFLFYWQYRSRWLLFDEARMEPVGCRLPFG